MPTVSLTLSVQAANEVNDAFAALYGYQATVTKQTGSDNGGNPVFITVPNPESKAQFAKRKIAEFIKERVITYRRQVALAAVSTADADVS